MRKLVHYRRSINANYAYTTKYQLSTGVIDVEFFELDLQPAEQEHTSYLNLAPI